MSVEHEMIINHIFAQLKHSFLQSTFKVLCVLDQINKTCGAASYSQ